MPKVPRNYQRKDYSALLAELRSSYTATEAETAAAAEKTSPKQESSSMTAARRLRSSKMDNRRLRYAYSKKQMILHDKDCDLVRMIPDWEFDMVETIPKGMTICQKCYRRALIRSAVGDDSKKMNAYVRFFDTIEASNSDLYMLLVEHHASIHWENPHTLTIKVNEDRWQIVHMEQGNLLYHNNYYVLEDYSRHFLNDYHEQRVNGTQDFHHYSYIISHYSWAEHVESMKERARLQETQAIQEAQTARKIQTAQESKTAQTLCNYIRLDRFSLFHAHYMFVDCKEHLADSLFLSRHIRVRFGKEYARPDTPYRFRLCKIRKRQEALFLETLAKLPEEMSRRHYKDYAEFCHTLPRELS